MDDLLNHQSNSYLNHEYLAQHWTPMSFSEVFNALQDARLKFACSANPTHFFGEHFLVPSQRAFLAPIVDTATRQTARDMLVNRQFRHDYWIKGGLQLPDTQAQRPCVRPALCWCAARLWSVRRWCKPLTEKNYPCCKSCNVWPEPTEP